MLWFQCPLTKKLIWFIFFPSIRKEGTKSFFSGRDLAAHLPSKSQVVIPTKNLDVKEKARNEDTAKNDAQPSKPVSEEISQRPR